MVKKTANNLNPRRDGSYLVLTRYTVPYSLGKPVIVYDINVLTTYDGEEIDKLMLKIGRRGKPRKGTKHQKLSYSFSNPKENMRDIITNHIVSLTLYRIEYTDILIEYTLYTIEITLCLFHEYCLVT